MASSTSSKPKTAEKAEAPSYDPAKRYAVSLTRVVEPDGFVLKPGPNPIGISGDLCASIAAQYGAEAIADAKALPPAPDHPEAPAAVHETADQ